MCVHILSSVTTHSTAQNGNVFREVESCTCTCTCTHPACAVHSCTCTCILSTAEGSYFSSHYHLGHRKFESGEPELFLFGELNDINFLNTKPVSVSERERKKEKEREKGRERDSLIHVTHTHTYITVSL